MITFANILKEAELMLKTTTNFSVLNVTDSNTTKPQPSISMPATETKQGEQKIPTVKPNGITR